MKNTDNARTLAKNQIVLKEGNDRVFVSYGCKIAKYNAKTFRFTFYTNKEGDLYAFASKTTTKYLWEFISYETDATYNNKAQILKALEFWQITTEQAEGNDYTKEKLGE